MEIFLEKEDIEKYFNLKINNQKQFKDNLKFISKRNFDLLSTKDISQFDFEFKLCENSFDLNDKDEMVVNDILKYFGLNKLHNSRIIMNVRSFLQYLNKNNLLKLFIENFSYYREYKKLTEEKVHGLIKFIGSSEENYEDGIWKCENYERKFEQIKQTHKKMLGHKNNNSNLDFVDVKFEIERNFKTLNNERKIG